MSPLIKNKMINWKATKYFILAHLKRIQAPELRSDFAKIKYIIYLCRRLFYRSPNEETSFLSAEVYSLALSFPASTVTAWNCSWFLSPSVTSSDSSTLSTSRLTFSPTGRSCFGSRHAENRPLKQPGVFGVEDDQLLLAVPIVVVGRCGGLQEVSRPVSGPDRHGLV